ncbi:MAG: hypothetical protein LBV12_08465, partial [Puniceicoccales bacterium]|nr:hypothetical protein [Puniceicoccales bacterium]
MNPPDKNKKRQRTPGEPMVWFSGLGLTLGLLMVAGLLAVIVYNGVAVFWPARVARISLVEGKNSPAGRDFFAVLVREREKVASHGTGAQEQLLFAGNKNFLGTAYFYNDTDSIAREDYPKSLLRIERAEFGDALIDPVSLTTREGKVVPVGDSDFAGNLEK